MISYTKYYGRTSEMAKFWEMIELLLISWGDVMMFGIFHILGDVELSEPWRGGRLWQISESYFYPPNFAVVL